MNWKYRGCTITLDDDGVFHADVDDERFEAPSLQALKKKIAGHQDGKRKFDVPCWVIEISGLYDEIDDIKLRSGFAQYTGYNLVSGHPKLSFTDKDLDDVRVNEYDVTLWAFPVGNRGAAQRLENVAAEYATARELFRERLEKLEHFRMPESVGRGDRGLAIEAKVAERLIGGTPVTP